MGRTTDALLKGTTGVLRKGARAASNAAKCLTLLKVATSRIKVMKNKRSMSAKQMRREIAELIKSGKDAHVYTTKVDAIIKQENILAVYDILDQYCHTIMSRYPAIELQRNCPADMKEPIASIIYAAPRCIELEELGSLKDFFVAKYGKEFGAAASELRPDCGVNTQVIELLSTRPANGDMKLKLLKEICKEHKVDWTPGEAFAGPGVATGLAEAKVEPMQATGTLEIKANTVGVGDAVPSRTAPLQGDSKHGASNKIGLAEAMTSIKASSSKTSDQKKISSSEGDVTKGKPHLSESFKGAVSTAPLTKSSSKAAMPEADTSKVDESKSSAFEEEDARRLLARISQSLKGGSFVDSEADAETKLEEPMNAQVEVNDIDSDSFASVEEGRRLLARISQSLKGGSFVDSETDTEKNLEEPMDAQVEVNDIESDSYVSVDEGRFEDNVDSSSHGAASREESFPDNPNQGSEEADLKPSSVTKKISTSSQKDVYSRASSSLGATSTEESFQDSFQEADLKYPRPVSTSSQQDIYSRTSSRNSGGDMETHEVMLASGNFSSLPSEGSHGDISSKVDSKKALNAEEELDKLQRNDSLSKEKFVEAHSVEGLKEMVMINEVKDKFTRVSSKKNSNVAEKMDEGTRKDSLNMGRFVEALSAEVLNEDRNIDETVAEKLSIETSDKEGLQRKDSVEKKSTDLTTESPVEKKLSGKYSFEARKTAEGLGDESCLHGEGIMEVTPCVATSEIEVSRNGVKECFLYANRLEFIADKKSGLPVTIMLKEQSGSRRGFDEEMPFAAGEEACVNKKDLPGHICDEASRVFGEERSPSSENALEIGGGELDSSSAVGKGVELGLLESEMQKDQSGSERRFDEETSYAAGEEACLNKKELPGRVYDEVSRVFGEEPLPSSKNALETGGELGSLPVVGKSVKKLDSPSAFDTLEDSKDFAAAAKAIAAEAARLAILDYAKRLAESSAIPLDVGELSKLGIAFEEHKGGLLNQYTDSEGLGYAGNRKSYETDAIKDKKVLLVEASLNCDENIDISDHLDADEMTLINEKSKHSVANDALVGDSNSFNASITAEKEPKFQEMVTEIEGINPFAFNVATNTDKHTYSPLSNIDAEEVSRVGMTQPGQSSKKGIGQDDHLDIFFRRKTPWMSEENPMLDVESYPKLKPSFMEGRMPYEGSEIKKSSMQENLFSEALFDTPTQRQNTVFKERSDPVKIPLFDEDDGGAFKSPVFDEGPEPSDTVYSSDNGLEKSYICPAVADKRRPQMSKSIKSPASFDPEPEPFFDEVADEEELFFKGREESRPMGQLKWQPKKPMDSDEPVATGNQSGFNVSDTSSNNPMSRRSRRQQPKVYDDSKHHGDSTSRSSLVQQPYDEPARKDEDNVGEKTTRRREHIRPYVSSSSAMSQRPSDLPKGATSKADYDSPLEDEWDFTSPKMSSTRTTKSPTRLDDRQRIRPEDFYFPEKDDLSGSPAGISRSKKANKSPARMTRQQLMTHGYVGEEEDHVGIMDQHGMVEDDHIEVLTKYKLSSQNSELSKRTTAGSGLDSQQRHRQQKPVLRSEYEHYGEDGGESSRIRPVSSRLQNKYMKEEEPYMVSRYKPMIEGNEPLDYGNRSKPFLVQPEKDEQEDNEQQCYWQEEPGMGSSDVGETLRTRPISSRQGKKYNKKEELNLVSRYKPTMQDDERLDYCGSSFKSRISKWDVDEDTEQIGSEYKQNREDVSESLIRPMSNRLPKKHVEEESHGVSRYMTMIQDGQPLDYRSSNKSRTPKLYDPVDEDGEGLHTEERFQTQTDDLGKRTSASSGVNRRHQQRWQEEDALESGYVHYEKVAAGGTSRSSADQKPSGVEEAQDLASDNLVKNSSSRPRPSRQQEKKHIEVLESAPRYNTPISTDDGWQEEEELFISGRTSQQKQGSQQKQNWTTQTDGYERGSQSKRQNPHRHNQIQPNKQQLVSGSWQSQSMAEEELLKEGRKPHSMSSSHKNHHQEEKKDLLDEPCELHQEKQRHKSTSSLERPQEQDSSNSPKSNKQEPEQQFEGMSAHEEGFNAQKEKTPTDNEALANKQHQNRAEEEVSGKQDKLGTESQLLTTERPSQSTSLPLESSISDPIVLATIPPPAKKSSIPPLSTTKIESSTSAPSPSKTPEVKVPKVPQKPPNIQDLAANFEALRKARKGEKPSSGT